MPLNAQIAVGVMLTWNPMEIDPRWLVLGQIGRPPPLLLPLAGRVDDQNPTLWHCCPCWLVRPRECALEAAGGGDGSGHRRGAALGRGAVPLREGMVGCVRERRRSEREGAGRDVLKQARGAPQDSAEASGARKAGRAGRGGREEEKDGAKSRAAFGGHNERRKGGGGTRRRKL